MSLRDYDVKRDKFQENYNISNNFIFPCCACKFVGRKDSEEPCRTCDFNLNAISEQQELSEKQKGGPIKSWHFHSFLRDSVTENDMVHISNRRHVSCQRQTG